MNMMAGTLIAGTRDTDPIIEAFEKMVAIEDACVLSDEDADGHASWLKQWMDAQRLFADMPASTLAGMALKLESAEHMSDALYQRALNQVVEQLRTLPAAK